MRLSVTVEGREHWVEWRDGAVMTRRAVREFFTLEHVNDDDYVLQQYGAWIESCSLTDEDGREFTSIADLSTEALDGLHPALMRWFYRLPGHAADEQASLGEAKSRR